MRPETGTVQSLTHFDYVFRLHSLSFHLFPSTASSTTVSISSRASIVRPWTASLGPAASKISQSLSLSPLLVSISSPPSPPHSTPAQSSWILWASSLPVLAYHTTSEPFLQGLTVLLTSTTLPPRLLRHLTGLFRHTWSLISGVSRLRCKSHRANIIPTA